MQTRREFLKNAAFFTGSIGMWGALEGTIRQAMAIAPDPGTSYLDAEHVVILMQENRSFDHTYGTLQGVRGYNDPRAITLANNNPVWVQTNAAGESYAPFRLNIKDTKATWMGFLPHNWASQVDARNDGEYDHWLQAKRSGHREFAQMPLTLGFYNRQDIPFYYSFADAFTICDQHFCSSITATLPNRVFFWTGSVREKQSLDYPACVRNEQIFNKDLTGWTTFPERLEDAGIPWRFYQNELSVKTGLTREEDSWLGNYGCNILEDFAQYNVKFAKLHREWLPKEEIRLKKEIEALEKDPSGSKTTDDAAKSESPGASQGSRRSGNLTPEARLEELKTSLKKIEEERAKYTDENFEKLSPREKSLHEKAFITNAGDPDYRQLVELVFKDGATERRMHVPKGDVLHQFREDVKAGKLPTVAWLAAPEKLSDHPTSAWYGAWYISEVIKILSENPEVWKKTIFILTYDENDGYYDHVPPFVAPRPGHPETGFISKGLDATLEYVELEADQKLKLRNPRQSAIGLGFRVPLLVASPWSRGGCVCSEVLDNTSVLMFLETFLTKKTGKPIKETNISSWRRAICGDMTSVFQPAPSEKDANPRFIARDPFVEQIYDAQYKPLPSGYKALTKDEIEQIKTDPAKSDWMPRQEPGLRRSAPLPYELYVDGALNSDRTQFTIRMESRKDRFGELAAGCPFTVYARTGNDAMKVRDYAVAAGDHLQDSWNLADFADNMYHLEVYGPNGFYRAFVGNPDDPLLELRVGYSQNSDGQKVPSSNVEVQIVNRDDNRALNLEITDRSYKSGAQKVAVAGGSRDSVTIDTSKSFGWYDFEVKTEQAPKFAWRFAGRAENGQWSFSDPAMGRTVG